MINNAIYYTDCWFNLMDRPTWAEAFEVAHLMSKGSRYRRYRVSKRNGLWQIDFKWVDGSLVT